MFSIYDENLKIHLTGNRAFEYIQKISIDELYRITKEYESWDGAVIQGADNPIDCSIPLEALRAEINYRKATNE